MFASSRRSRKQGPASVAFSFLPSAQLVSARTQPLHTLHAWPPRRNFTHHAAGCQHPHLAVRRTNHRWCRALSQTRPVGGQEAHCRGLLACLIGRASSRAWVTTSLGCDWTGVQLICILDRRRNPANKWPVHTHPALSTLPSLLIPPLLTSSVPVPPSQLGYKEAIRAALVWTFPVVD